MMMRSLEHHHARNGVVSTYTYNFRGRISSIENTQEDGTVLSSFTYTYNAMGQVTSMLTHYGSWLYTHDLDGRLTGAVLESTDSAIDGQALTFVYDEAGNRISKTHNGEETAYSYNSANQCLSENTTSQIFDDDGNLTRLIQGAESTDFSYDALNH